MTSARYAGFNAFAVSCASLIFEFVVVIENSLTDFRLRITVSPLSSFALSVADSFELKIDGRANADVPVKTAINAIEKNLIGFI